MGSDADVRIVEQFLADFNRHRLMRLIRLTRADLSIQLPDGTTAQGRLATGRLIAWVLRCSRGTLRMTPLSVAADGDGEVIARTHNAARRGKSKLALEMVLVFTVRDGRISAIRESVEDLAAWNLFWRSAAASH